jgi:hypothetical protein
MMFAMSSAQSKPKIQRIVWEPESRGSGQTSSQSGLIASGSVQGTVSPLVSDPGLAHSRRGAVARGYHAVSGGQGGYRSGQLRGSPRASVQQGSTPVIMNRQPGAVQPQRFPQVARRARGRGSAGPRGGYY